MKRPRRPLGTVGEQPPGPFRERWIDERQLRADRIEIRLAGFLGSSRGADLGRWERADPLGANCHPGKSGSRPGAHL